MSLKGKLYTSCWSFCCNKVAPGTCCLTREERDSVAQYLSIYILEKTKNHIFYEYSVNNQKVSSECFKVSAKKVKLSKAH